MSTDPDQIMTFWDHLTELRSRLVRMVLSFAVGAGVAWYFRTHVLYWLTKPFIDAWHTGGVKGDAALHFQAPAAQFLAYLKLSFLAGFVFALPVILYQVWAFVAPGLYSKEKRYALPFVISSCLLFGAGGYFGWRFAFPAIFEYFLGLGGGESIAGFDVKPTVMVGEYIDFVMQMLLAFGLVFELPVVIFFLSITGVINHTHLIKFARYFVVVAFVIGAIFSPPDVMSQLLLAGPMCLLYLLSIGIAWIFGRKPQAESESESEG